MRRRRAERCLRSGCRLGWICDALALFVLDGMDQMADGSN